MLNNLGNALLAGNRADEAIAAYRLVLAVAPSFVDTRRNLATALDRQDRHLEAARCLDEVVGSRHGDRLIAPRRARRSPPMTTPSPSIGPRWNRPSIR